MTLALPRLLGSAGSAVVRGTRLPRAWVRMAEPQQLLLKRQRLVTSASSESAAHQQQTAAGPPPDGQQQQQQQQQQGQQQGQPPRKPKAVVMPTPVPPPAIPADPAAWDNAMVLVDKPVGWTSFDVCGKLRHSLAALLRKKNREVKVGHAGTLDPAATGLLIVCVGRGTKAVDTFMAMRKRYTGSLRLGEATPSYDAETPVETRLPWEHITDEQLAAARDGFLGETQQLPPMYSAIKVGGKKLYEAARKGQEIERERRTITVERFDLRRDAADPQTVHFDVVCSKGTYIRSLAFDLGAAVGSAAHLTALRREEIGEHSVQGAWDVLELADQIHKLRQARRAQQEAEEEAAAAAAGGGEAAAAAGGGGGDGASAAAAAGSSAAGQE